MGVVSIFSLLLVLFVFCELVELGLELELVVLVFECIKNGSLTPLNSFLGSCSEVGGSCGLVSGWLGIGLDMKERPLDGVVLDAGPEDRIDGWVWVSLISFSAMLDDILKVISQMSLCI